MNANYVNPSDSPLATQILRHIPSKLALIIASAMAISACQPSDSVSDDTSSDASEQTSSNDSGSEKNQSLSSEHAKNIETLAGVPMQQLVSFDPQEIKQGGDSGISISSAESYSKPSSNLAASRKGSFFIGNAFFKQPWVVARIIQCGRLPVLSCQRWARSCADDCR
jgi:hypothetical protein